MDSRDINDHDMRVGPTDKMSCEEYAKMIAAETPPYDGDPFIFDCSRKGTQTKTGICQERIRENPGFGVSF